MKKIGIIIIVFLSISNIPVSAKINGQYRTTDDELADFSDFEGEPLLLEAFSTTCSHCIDMHTEMETIHNTSTIGILSISINNEDNLQTLSDYNETYPMPWAHGLKADDTLDSYDVRYTPTMILFDSNGNFANCWVGKVDASVILTGIDALNADPAAYVAANSGDGKCDNPQSSFQIMLYGFIALGIIYVLFKFTNNKFVNK